MSHKISTRHYPINSSRGTAYGLRAGLLAVLLGAGAARAQAPVVTRLAPLRNALSVPRSTPLTITFGQLLSANATTQQALRVFSAQAGGYKAGPASVSDNTLTILPATAFQPGETVFATLTTAVQSSTAQHLVAPQVFQFTTATAPSAGVFDGGLDLAVDSKPTSVALGDIDGDGDLDVITANNLSNAQNTGTLSVCFNNGAGIFTSTQTVAVGRGTFQAVLADLDADGDLDLLTANSADLTDLVSVRYNNGRGGFGTGYEIGGGSSGKNPHGLAVGDINGDGRLDVLVAYYTDDSNPVNSVVNVLTNNVNGTYPFFALSQSVEVGPRPLNVALGDVDADGDLDFITASSKGNTASVRVNDGTGRFSGAQEVPVGFNPQTVVLGDVDGDGDLDITTVNYYDYTNPIGTFTSSTASVRRNDGRGAFGGAQEVTLGQGGRTVVLGDVDGDGDLDLLATGELSNAVSVRRNDGTGNFKAGQEVGVGQGAYGLALGDVDGNGTLDVVTSNAGSNTISVRLNRSQALAATSPQATEELSVYPNPSAGQFTLSYAASRSQAAALTLTDVLGRLMWQQAVPVQAGAGQVPVATAGLSAGFYQLTLRLADGKQLSRKISLLP